LPRDRNIDHDFDRKISRKIWRNISRDISEVRRMASFDSNGVKIHFADLGGGDPVVLVHGFASNAQHNWELTGWYKTLTPDYRVVALDCRGHGQSDKPHDVKAYGGTAMEDDVIRLMDHLGIERSLLMGYSMGGRISMGLLARHPERFRVVVLGGVGAGMGVADPVTRKPIVAALLSDDKSKVSDPRARLFRDFAEANQNDLKALAACMAADREPIAASQFTNNKVPVMVVVGTKDELVAKPEEIAIMIPGAKLLKLEGRDHLNAPGAKGYHQAVVKFFETAPK
jgi:pimeloyl-ACP methyl ester carboxylesterase